MNIKIINAFTEAILIAVNSKSKENAVRKQRKQKSTLSEEEQLTRKSKNKKAKKSRAKNRGKR